MLHPYVEVTVHAPDWTYSQSGEGGAAEGEADSGEEHGAFGAQHGSSGSGGSATASTTTQGALSARFCRTAVSSPPLPPL